MRQGISGFRVLCVAFLIAALAAGCGGSALFLPDAGAFLGSFKSATLVKIGDLSFTASQSGVAGTGVLHDGTLDVSVAVSANVNGKTITGHVSNELLGNGTFKGAFLSDKTAAGTFTFDVVTDTQLSGTWSASVN